MMRSICKALIATTACAALFAGWLTGCSGSAASNPADPPTAPAERQITIDNFSFDPRTLTIPPGTKVTWLNRDDVPHTVTSSDSPPKFKSPPLDTDEKYTQVYSVTGTYRYFCALHPHMTAQLIVK